MESDKFGILLPLPDIQGTIGRSNSKYCSQVKGEGLSMRCYPELADELWTRYVESMACNASLANKKIARDSLDIETCEVRIVSKTVDSRLMSFLRIRTPASLVRMAKIHDMQYVNMYLLRFITGRSDFGGTLITLMMRWIA